MKIRVMIVEDSFVVRQFLETLIGADPRLEVAASVKSAEEALEVLHRVSPDVVSMDIRLPGMNGFEATQRIMAEKPTPIVVVSASVEADDLKISMNALRAGALTVIEKPVGTTHRDYALLADRLCTQLVLMSQVKVVRQRTRLRQLEACTKKNENHYSGRQTKRPTGPFRMLGIVASTGGPGAVQQLLGALGPDFPIPVLLVQHMTDSFMEGFVSWLDSASPLSVAMAADGDAAQSGRVYVAPSGRHLCLEGTTLRLVDREPICQQRPSGTLLFESMAQNLGARSIGVVLTGMGDDGAAGLNRLRQAGGYTIAEDRSTAVVYGMPAAAMALGAARESLPLTEICQRLIQLACSAVEPIHD